MPHFEGHPHFAKREKSNIAHVFVHSPRFRIDNVFLRWIPITSPNSWITLRSLWIPYSYQYTYKEPHKLIIGGSGKILKMILKDTEKVRITDLQFNGGEPDSRDTQGEGPGMYKNKINNATSLVFNLWGQV